MNRIKWQANINDNNDGGFGHYGAPLVTENSTVIIARRISAQSVDVDARDGADGSLKYTLTTDYVYPPYGWMPVYQPVLVGTRLYYPGAGGTVYFVDNADTDTPSAPTRISFYSDLPTYEGDKANFDSTVFINTPITADSSGNIYFGFRLTGAAPAPLSTSMGGYAKISSAGVGTYVLADAMVAGDTTLTRPCHNTAPALSNDESKVYVVVKHEADAYHSYLVALNATDLSTSSSVFLLDPRVGAPAGMTDNGTSSPVIGPDGDVYLGVFANPYNGSRGFLAHFSGDLSETKTYGGFGWDYTPGIVPASMVPSYQGTSSYLLFCKYNNYTGTGLDDGDGANRMAILDPNALQTDIHPSSNGLQIMREVLTAIAPTPDDENPQSPIAVREMCVNATCVNPATNSVFYNSEDGKAYRWDLTVNQATQVVELNEGFGQPYVPTIIGPDGTVYTLNGGNLFAFGGYDTTEITISSDNPDSRSALTSTPITFTAHVATPAAANQPNGVVPTNVVEFYDLTYNGYTPVETLIGAVPLDVNGNASVTTTLSSSVGQLGNHFIRAHYTGNGTNEPGDATLMQKVHAFATSTLLTPVTTPSAFGQPVALNVTVSGLGTTDIPTGQVTFVADNKVIGQVPLDGAGNCTFTTSDLLTGNHDVQAYYQSDTFFASSDNTQEVLISDGTNMDLQISPNPASAGQLVTITATITPQNAGSGTPTGTVKFDDGLTTLDTVTVDSNGVATFTSSTFTVGTHSITAVFTGSNGWTDSQDDGISLSITGNTTTLLVSSLNPSTVGDLVTFTATTSGTSGGGTPTGSVVFTVDGNAGSPVSVDGSGQATLATNTLTQGSHSISVAFTGTGGWGSGASNTVNQQVNAGTDGTPPSVPQNFAVNSGPGKNKLTLSWSASSDTGGSGVHHYEVWRSNKANAGFNMIATTTGTSYADNVGNKQTRYYYIVAVDGEGNRSDPTGVKFNTSPAAREFGGKEGGD
jgi:hypothetical protein